MNNINTTKVKHYDGTGLILPIAIREKQAKGGRVRPQPKKPRVSAQEKEAQKRMNAWRDDPRMVFLANPYKVKPDGTRVARDLTKAEREEWERNIGQYQIYGHR